MLRSLHLQLDLNSYSLHPMLNSHHYNAITLDYLIKRTCHSVLIVGSLDGLLCIVINERHLVLWNPSTRVLKRFPDPGLKMQCYHFKVCGFGFNERTNDYKVVGISHPTYEVSKSIMVWVYSSRADSWKIVTDFPCNIRENGPGKFTNGSLHWAVKASVSPGLWTIVSFDLSNETYGEIEQPNYNVSHRGMVTMVLGVVQGCLSMLVDSEEVCLDLWVMKEYGVKDSWLKLCVMPFCGRPAGYISYSFPLLISSSGELLIEARDSYFLYNPKEGTFRNIGDSMLGSLTNAFTYVESLVSPNTEAA